MGDLWWCLPLRIINSWCICWRVKKIVLFATSGGSDMGTEAAVRAAEISRAEVPAGKRFAADAPADELKEWAAGYC